MREVNLQTDTKRLEPCEDAISRQAAIDALRAMQTYKLFAGDDMLLIDQAGAQTELMQLPPIQPKLLQPWEVLVAQAVLSQPKRGKWIRDGHHIRCDQCGIYMCDTDREGDRIPTEFCPNCGSYNGGENEI